MVNGPKDPSLGGVQMSHMSVNQGLDIKPDYNDLSESYLWVACASGAVLLFALVVKPSTFGIPLFYGQAMQLLLGVTALLVLFYIAIAFWNSTQAKILERAVLVSQIRVWNGKEYVLGLDGDGKGAFLIEAAKQLRADAAQKMALSLHSSSSHEYGARTMLNAVAESVDHIVGVQSGLPTQLPFPDETFDVVLATYAFGGSFHRDRAKILGEMWRVVKPGGQLCILDFQKKNILKELKLINQSKKNVKMSIQEYSPSFQKLGTVCGDCGIMVVDKVKASPASQSEGPKQGQTKKDK